MCSFVQRRKKFGRDSTKPTLAVVSDPGTDFSAASLAQAQLIAGDLEASSLQQIEEAMDDGYIEEICHDR